MGLASGVLLAAVGWEMHGAEIAPISNPPAADADGAAVSRQARDFWRDAWQGRSMMAVGAQDPVLGLPVMAQLRANIRGCPEPMVLAQAGHFVPEHGAAIAEQALRVLTHG